MLKEIPRIRENHGLLKKRVPNGSAGAPQANREGNSKYLGNLVANLVPNLVDSNSLNVSLFFHIGTPLSLRLKAALGIRPTLHLNRKLGTGF